ncbi:glycogen phosphorylase, partial [Klebsiella pneumoniae]|nr:glycogen phosphorylase [Klebsiella pneumoniae]
RRLGHHHNFYHQNPAMARVVDTLVSGLFTSDRELFAPLHHMLTEGDHYCHLLDFDSYCQAQQQAMIDFEQPEQWHRQALLNICRMGEFSSDRTIRGYARDIWGITS